MSSEEIDPRFDTPANADVLRYLRRELPSAHSDLSEELTRSVAGLSDVETYCPTQWSYAFVVLHGPDQTIFGLAAGMSALAYRLAPARLPAALEDGAWPAPELGRDWVRFEPWTDEPLAESRRRLARWCRAAAEDAGAV